MLFINLMFAHNSSYDSDIVSLRLKTEPLVLVTGEYLFQGCVGSIFDKKFRTGLNQTRLVLAGTVDISMLSQTECDRNRFVMR